jgi:hypothetical protein
MLNLLPGNAGAYHRLYLYLSAPYSLLSTKSP